MFGYTILNDVSARDVQTAHKQWYFGKSLDGFTPMGPCIVTADEFDTYPPALPIRSRVNGELRQDSNTKLQIFDIDHVIHELSQGMTLKAGTIIATGTLPGWAWAWTRRSFAPGRHRAVRDRGNWHADQHRALNLLVELPKILHRFQSDCTKCRRSTALLRKNMVYYKILIKNAAHPHQRGK